MFPGFAAISVMHAQRQAAGQEAGLNLAALKEENTALEMGRKAGRSLKDSLADLNTTRRAAILGSRELAEAEAQAAAKNTALHSSMKETTSAGAAHSSMVGGLTNRILRLGLVIAGYRGISWLAQGVRDLFLFNSEIEQMRLGVAETITTAGRFVDVFGKPLPMAQQLSIAFRQSDQAVKEMLQDAVKLGIPLEAIRTSYMATAGAAAAAGKQQSTVARAG